MTGLMGRWRVTGTEPKVVCDTGHNADGCAWCVSSWLRNVSGSCMWYGACVPTKDVPGILRLLPVDAVYYFTQASVKRALPSRS